jgi:hypothetical protein
MRTTLTLDDRVYEYAKSIAALSGKGLSEIVSRLALAGIESEKTVATSPGKRDLPVLDPGRPAKVNVAALTRALEDLP